MCQWSLLPRLGQQGQVLVELAGLDRDVRARVVSRLHREAMLAAPDRLVRLVEALGRVERA